MEELDYVWVFVRPDRSAEFAMLPPAPVFPQVQERRTLKLLKTLAQWVLKITLLKVNGLCQNV